MSLGPFDLAGGPFLALYLLLFLASLIASLAISRLTRQPGHSRSVSDIDELAFLIGGGRRFGEAVVAGLLAKGALAMTDRKRFHILAEAGPFSAAERRVLALPGETDWREIESAIRSCGEPIERRLVQQGLLIGTAEAHRARMRSILPFLLLFLFGSTKWIIGHLRDRPTGYLSLLLILTIVAGAVRWLSFDRRTKAAHEAIDRARQRASRLRIAPTHSEMALAVALYGTTVLAGSAWSDFHRLRGRDGGASGCGSGDGGGGGGGCGGGGCGGGGCGGCSS